MVTSVIVGRLPPANEIAVRWAMGRDDLNERSSELYTAAWENWLTWLDARGVRWHEAGAEHVNAFLKGAAPGITRRRPPKIETRMANLTAQRYGSLLDKIYGFAAEMGWVSANPVFALGRKKPQVLLRSRKAEVLPPGVLELMRSPTWLETALPAKRNGDWLPLRDRSIVALLAHLGLACAELIRLRAIDLREGTRQLAPDIEFAAMVGASKRGPQVDVVDARKKNYVERSLPIPSAIVPMQIAWLQQRAELDGAAHDGPLFLSRERPAGGSLRTPLDAASVYLVVKRCVLLAAHECGLGDEVRAHGPAVVRNTVLQQWLKTMDKGTAAKFAGLAQIDSRKW